MKPLVLAVTITRDGMANPSRRLPDKHSRLFHGRTLDEWFCIRCWSSKYVTDFCVVGETVGHCQRLRPMVESYGGEVICRPRAYLHSLEDTGGQPMRWGMRQMARERGPYNLIIQSFVVNPVIPPGLWDKAVEFFMLNSQNVETNNGHPVLSPVYEPQETYREEDDEGRVIAVDPRHGMGNTGKVHYRWAGTDGWQVGTPEYYEWNWRRFNAGDWKGIVLRPMKFVVPRWTDVHIDTQEEWDLAEWEFGKYIGQGDTAAAKYSEYRREWMKDEEREIPGEGEHR